MVVVPNSKAPGHVFTAAERHRSERLIGLTAADPASVPDSDAQWHYPVSPGAALPTFIRSRFSGYSDSPPPLSVPYNFRIDISPPFNSAVFQTELAVLRHRRWSACSESPAPRISLGNRRFFCPPPRVNRILFAVCSRLFVIGINDVFKHVFGRWVAPISVAECSGSDFGFRDRGSECCRLDLGSRRADVPNI